VTFDDVRMRGFRARADVREVVAWIDARPAPLPAEDVHLLGTSGRVLARAIESPVDVPAFRRSAMDGWAVRGAETFGASELEPLSLPCVGESRPGEPPPPPLAPGTAMRIRTGAPVPEGADAVLPAESGTEEGSTLVVREPVAPGRHVGPVGEDAARGDALLPAGRRLRPQDLGLLSLVGTTRVSCVRKPRVAVLVTGAEILEAGSPPLGTRIPDANGPMLDALLRRDGAAPLVRGLFTDTDPRIEEEIASVAADLVLVTGASSVGPEDCVPEIVARRGTLLFHGLALRPASPTGLGLVAGRPVFLIPGNPVSALCAYDLLAGRLVRRLGGRSPELPYRVARLPLARKVVSELGRLDYLRVQVVDGRAAPLTSRGAGVLTTTTRADGFVLVPADAEGYPEGASVDVHLYDA